MASYARRPAGEREEGDEIGHGMRPLSVLESAQTASMRMVAPRTTAAMNAAR